MSSDAEVYAQFVTREQLERQERLLIGLLIEKMERLEILQEIVSTTGTHLTGTSLNDTRDKEGKTILMLAALHGNTRIAKYLVHRGANPNDRDKYGNTALILASAGGNIKILEFLLRNGANVNAKNKERKIALTYAVERGDSEMANVLRSYGAHDSSFLLRRLFSWLFGD